MNNGGPAFPAPVCNAPMVAGGSATGGASSSGHPLYFTQSGMSLRDWFAGQALPSVMAAVCDGSHVSKRDEEAAPQLIARTSYELADAMLAERSK